MDPTKNQSSNELYHYGVLGMKWGIRHDSKRSKKPANSKKAMPSRKNLSNMVKNPFVKNQNTPHILGEHTIPQDMAKVNPAYKSGSLESKTNCAYCSIAYDLRRRGINATAVEQVSEYGMDELSMIYKNKKTGENSTVINILDDLGYRSSGIITGQNTSSIANASPKFKDLLVSEINDYLLNLGDGARGIVGANWSNGSGHAFNFEVINGEVHWIDSQLNQEHDIRELMDRMYDLELMRTDDCEIDDKSLIEYATRTPSFSTSIDISSRNNQKSKKTFSTIYRTTNSRIGESKSAVSGSIKNHAMKTNASNNLRKGLRK